MTQPWLRLHRSAVNNIKLQNNGLEVVGFWVNLLCLTDDDGALPFALRNAVTNISWHMRVTESNAVTLLKSVMDAGLVTQDDDGTLRMHQWAEHQKRTDQPDYNAEKQKRYRKNKALRNAEVTPLPSRTDTDTEQNRGEGRRVTAPPPKKQTRLDKMLEPMKQEEARQNGKY